MNRRLEQAFALGWLTKSRKLQMASHRWPKFENRSGQFLWETTTARLMGMRSPSALLMRFSLIRNMKWDQIDDATSFRRCFRHYGLVILMIMDLSGTPIQYSLTMEGEYVVKMRLDPEKVSPAAYHAMLGLESFVSKSSKLEGSLLELVKMRASQINGCAFSIDMHSKDARMNGETEQRLYALSAWRETTFFTNRERAALAWTEALTLITEGRAPDEVYAEVRKAFGEEELVNLSLAIITINGWNRFGIGFRKLPGEYKPHKIGQAGYRGISSRKDRSDA